MQRRIKILSAIFVLIALNLRAQKFTDSTSFVTYVKQHASEFGLDTTILTDPKYRFQMVYTPVDSTMQMTSLQLGTDQYYFPASLVKLPAALVALEKMKRHGITLNDIPVMHRDNDCGSRTFCELSNRKTIDFGQMIEELIVVSDNHFYNTLYHFLTPETLNSALHEKGFTGTHIYRAFTGCEMQEQLYTNSMYVMNPEGEKIYEQESTYLDSNLILPYYHYSQDRLLGAKHENREGRIVAGPYDLNYSIEIPLPEIHEMLMRLVYPSHFAAEERWDIRESDRKYLLEVMKKYPRQIRKTYRPSVRKFPDNIYKYAMIGEESGTHSYETISKIGLSYGFTSETIYVKNQEDGVEFFLTVSLHTNANDIMNDGEYEYESVARPFIYSLSKLLYASRKAP